MNCNCPRDPKPPMDKPYLHHRECVVYQNYAPSIIQMDMRMSSWILDHASHPVGCKARAIDDDRRIADTLYPCSCGLSAILDVLEPGVKHQLDEEDEEDDTTPVDLDRQATLLHERLSGPGPKRPPRAR
jgi:hypothetical protein